MTDLQQQSLRGPVRTLRSEIAEWDTNRQQWQPPSRSETKQFHRDGRIAETETLNHDGSIARSGYTYDDAGRLVETTFQLGDGPVIRTVCTYDPSGRLVRNTIVDADGTRDLETYSYDETGRKTKVQFVPKAENAAVCGSFYGLEGIEWGFGAVGVKTITTLYDDRQQSSEGLLHDENGTLVLHILLTRNTAGHLVKVESRQANEPTSSIARMIEQMPAEERESSAAVLAQLFTPQSVMTSTAYQYDDHGRRIQRDVSMYGMSRRLTTWEYDEQDNPVQEITEDDSCDLQPDESGKLQPANQRSFRQEFRQDYKYDAFGNWTERVVTARYEANPEFQPSNIERREIVYYASP